MTVFLNDPDDCEWLANVHLDGDFPFFQSFEMSGNEDAPDEVKLFSDVEPSWYQDPIATYCGFNEDGKMVRVDI